MAPVLAQRSRTDRAFERLYRRHVADVYRYSLAVLRNPADAEDVTQTTFLNAYRAFTRGERPDAAQNWLIKIAHNVCRQRFRNSARRPHEVELDDGIAATYVQEQEGPSAQDIRRGLGQLAFNQRAALVMRELEGRSYAEIGEILGLSVAAVETLIFRARRALREQLEASLTCVEAELAISRQLDGRLSWGDKGALRAHLRQCGECGTFARRLRAQRSALKALAAVPIPGSLASFFGGTSVGSGVVALKVGAIAATFVAAGAVTSVEVKHAPWRAAHRPGAAAAASAPSALRLSSAQMQQLAGRPSVAGKSSRPPSTEVVVHRKLRHSASIARARSVPVRSSPVLTAARSSEHAQSASQGRSSNGRDGHDRSSAAGPKVGMSHNDHSGGGRTPKSDRADGRASHGGGKHAPIDASGALQVKGKG
jgi:RNA polymerase sigma factor (sigma-70 family)